MSIEASPKEYTSMWKTSFLRVDWPYRGWNSVQNLSLLNKLYQSRKHGLEYDCPHCRVSKYTIASREYLIVRPMRILKVRKKIGGPTEQG
jgi:hypothetical protein